MGRIHVSPALTCCVLHQGPGLHGAGGLGLWLVVSVARKACGDQPRSLCPVTPGPQGPGAVMELPSPALWGHRKDKSTKKDQTGGLLLGVLCGVDMAGT